VELPDLIPAERQRAPLRLARLLAALIAGCIAMSAAQGTAPQRGRTRPINSLQTIIDDMTLPHQGQPKGVPDSYGWAQGPVTGMGNHPPATWHAITAWGQLYVDAKGNPARNTRVQIRRMRTYILSKRDGKWRLVQSSEGVDGAAFREDFAENINRKPDLRHEPDGSVSVTAGGGCNFHFWPTDGRASINPRNIAGVFTTVEARLIVGDPHKPDDRSRARYLLSVGADYWVNRHASWDHFKTNDAVAMGHFKYVTARWQAFNCTTLTARELRRNPPPIE
jgi:hypothetical protein